MHQINTLIDKFVKSGVINGYIKYSSFALYFDYIYSELRNYFYYLQEEI